MSETSQVRLPTDATVIRAVLDMAPLGEYRCNFCNKLAFKGFIPPGGVVQINCPRDTCDKARRHLPDEQRFLTFASAGPDGHSA